MRLAIADPPYLGRAERWYGPTGGGGHKPSQPRADTHPAAGEWDDPARHIQLVRELQRDYGGWVIAAAADSLGTYLPYASNARVAVWDRRNAPPSGARILQRWEPVIYQIPDGRTVGMPRISDVLTCPGPRVGFPGAKPSGWTRWVLDLMGYDSFEDTVDDLFPGSGAVAAEIAQTVIL